MSVCAPILYLPLSYRGFPHPSVTMPPKRSRSKKNPPNPTRPTLDISGYSLEQISSLPVTTIRAHLQVASLSTAGLKKDLVERLFTHFHPQDNIPVSNSQPGSGGTSNGDGPDLPSSPSNLESTVARLVDAGIQSALSRLQPPSNISLPSGSGSPSPTRDNTQPRELELYLGPLRCHKTAPRKGQHTA